MTVLRRLYRLGLATAIAMTANLAGAPLAADQPVTFADLAGRTVTLARPAQRILLTEANDLLSLALIDPDPVSHIVGWAALRRFDSGTLEAFGRKFPAVATLAVVGDWTADTFSVEKAVSLKPDLVLMTAYQDPKLGEGEITRQFEAAGIPVAFITSGRNTQLSATDIGPRLRMLGRILGREKAAEDYIAFYDAHLRRVTERLAGASIAKPKVLIETYAGLAECCRAPGRHGWAEFVELAGGQNLGAVAPEQAGGMLSMEYLMAQQPDVYIGNGGSYLEGKGLVIGPSFGAEQIREALRALMARPGFGSLKAVKEGCVYGIWTVLAVQPVSILALEQIAKWLHPQLFADLDPSQTLADINSRFLAVPLDGIYWLALDDQGCRR